MSEYSQGVCEDGAAILHDGQMMTIEEILVELRERDAAIKRAQVAEDERDSLAANAEAAIKLVGWFSRVRVGSVNGVPLYAHQIDSGVERDVIAFLRRSPEAAKRALEAGAIDSLVPLVADGIGRTLDLSEDQIIEVEDWLGGHAELLREADQ